ncbi:methionyl-tRNA formyltransferase [Arthrobacter sp. UM1]|uniref:methionyl-tRNA formyltransferase n=1 Tax=Arthrobacter sp. UM1 TaxID=2766776 RepID=UPI001CF65CC0|nr:methionyl-tRNA formyltransferase [Arthrobacter sp. UM1]MCB4207633.1 methionyl-tRNA formyltransferase [Arthrobacter sp. UM1]
MSRTPLRILFAGTPANAAESLRQVSSALEGHEDTAVLVGVLTREDAPVGRKRVLTPSPVAQTAESLGLPVIKANRLTADVLEQVRSLEADASLVVAYGAMLRRDALGALPLGWYNLHYSLLPDLRGAAPVQWALIREREKTGVTLFRIDEGLDTGPVLGTWETPVGPAESAGELLERLTAEGSALAVRFLLSLSEDRSLADSGEEQDEEPASEYAPKLTAQDGLLDPGTSAAEAFSRARGTTPAPGPWMRLNGEKFKIAKVCGVERGAPSGGGAAVPPGSVTAHERGIAIAFSDGALVVERVQPAGKKEMSAKDWLRGVQAGRGENVRLTS